MKYNVIPVKFAKLGKRYYFDVAGFAIQNNDQVIVETVRGLELGFASGEIKMVDESEVVLPLKPILRLATEHDKSQYLENKANEANVLEKCSQMIKKNSLDMKLLNCEFTLDKQKLIIYFNAEGRVDFRDLVKDLATLFRVRIELRQVGARDGARVLGGIGPCGLLTCCTTFLGDFETVSIKMAKNQNLSLNPTNISGLCGKLLCCINYEDAAYKEARKQLPKADSLIETPDGTGKVSGLNFLTMMVTVTFPLAIRKTYHVSELKFKQKAAEEDLSVSAKELKGLEE